MIPCNEFFLLLKKHNIDFFTGVPDSLLKYFNAYIIDNADNHIIAANEGNAVGLATGYYLSTKKFGLVYMQNSGLGNAINPLTSLVDKEVYSIPMLLLIGWRGQPGLKDEPQHIKQGRITLKLLEVLEIPYEILPKKIQEVQEVILKAYNYLKNENAPFALVVEKNSFEPYELQKTKETPYKLTREDAIKTVIDQLNEEDIVVSTTGKASRELFEYREQSRTHKKDFLTVGSMGHTSQIALGIALAKPNKNVYCLDGDGAIIMHMGSLAVIGAQKPENFKHIILNNGAHDSVGGQPTAGFKINFTEIAKACGYSLVLSANNKEEISKKLVQIQNNKGPALLEIKIKTGSRKELGRPTRSPKENKKEFMDSL